jgi:hypothetical protein
MGIYGCFQITNENPFLPIVIEGFNTYNIVNFAGICKFATTSGKDSGEKYARKNRSILSPVIYQPCFCPNPQ